MEESNRDPIPLHFSNLWEAGEFWDAHSAADYWDEMEEVEIEFALQDRLFFVPVQNDIYYQIRQRATKEGRPLPDLVNDMLLHELA
jgi:hypothetical protein